MHLAWKVVHVCVGADREYLYSAIKKKKRKEEEKKKKKTVLVKIFFLHIYFCDTELKRVFIFLCLEKLLSIHIFIYPYSFKHLFCPYSVKDTTFLNYVAKLPPNCNAQALLTSTQET